MSNDNKVAWLESLYLFPHHFQQQERYLEARIEQRSRAIAPFMWGYLDLILDLGLLNNGQVGLSRARGIMPDGCPFELPKDASLPQPLEIDRDVRNQLVYLTLPIYQPGNKYVAGHEESDSITRYGIQTRDVYDYSSDNNDSEPLDLASLQFRLALEREELGGFTTLPVARIQEVTAEGAVIIDKHYIPPVLAVRCNGQLQHFLTNTIGLVKQRADVLSHRFAASNQEGGSSAIADFMLLQMLNRYEPRLRHMSQVPQFHPEAMYRELLGLAGELSTFTTLERRPKLEPDYQHDNLQECFRLVIDHLGKYLSTVLEQTAIPQKIEKHKYGIYVSRIADHSLINQARFILAIKADMPTDKLREYMPKHVKVGSVETIRNLVNNQLSGIGLSVIPVAPREIPYHSGFVYFELDSQGEQWQSLKTAGGFAFHIAAEQEGLEVEFWAIRQ